MIDLETLLERLVDFESGLITCISEVPTQFCEPLIQIYLAEFSDPVVIDDARGRPRTPHSARQASGAGLNRTEALWSTVGEAIERYSAAVYSHIPRVTALADNVPGGRAFLERMIHFAETSYVRGDVDFAKPDPNVARDWVKAQHLLTGAPCYVPASLTFIKFNAPRESDILDRTYSTGLACHTTLNAAAMSGLCELIERDAYCCYWLTGAPPVRLARDFVLRCLPQAFSTEIERLALDFRLLALRTDMHTPVLVCVIPVPGGGIATGASCHLNPMQALRKAVVEAFHTFNWCLEMQRLHQSMQDPTLINNFRDHVAWYLDPQRSARYRWLTQDMLEMAAFPDDWTPMDTDQMPADKQVKILAQRIVDGGFDPLLADLTSPDVHMIGFHVIRAFAAGLQPLSAGYKTAHTDPRRLEAFLAWCGTPRTVMVKLDPPHCFP
ncbi:YcaO-like family protein [Aeromonas enteropelogenes]|uniref:YcaO-like family protein n=1 Tax=Aeromonas enteropelogenes TaxID=29489 RepID=UPI003BA30208